MLSSWVTSTALLAVLVGNAGVWGLPAQYRYCPVASTDCTEYGTAFETLAKQVLNATMVGVTSMLGGADPRTALSPGCSLAKLLGVCGEDYFATCDPLMRYGSSAVPRYITDFRESVARTQQSCVDGGITDTDTALSVGSARRTPEGRAGQCPVASYSCQKFGRAVGKMGQDLAGRALIEMRALLNGESHDVDATMASLCRSGAELEVCADQYIEQCGSSSSRVSEAMRNFHRDAAKLKESCVPYVGRS